MAHAHCMWIPKATNTLSEYVILIAFLQTKVSRTRLIVTLHVGYIACLWSDFDRASSLICGNKMPTRCNRWYLLQMLLHAQNVSGTTMPIIRSSRVLYKWLLPVVFGALVFRLSVWCVQFAGCCSSPQTGHITLSSTPYRQPENQSTKYHRQQPLV